MIIATALGKVFKDLKITYNSVEQTVNYHYGDQKELLAWINLKTKAKKRKYPLVWYVLSNFTEFDGWYETDATLVILQNTKSEWFNPERQSESYTKIIEPVWQEVKTALRLNQQLSVMGNLATQYTILDEPNYGVDPNSNDLKTTNSKNSKSVTTDVTDARVIRFKLRIKANCIIN